MTTVHAGQHIYTNVEEEQSPSKRGGYQTLFYTRSVLSEIESEEIEARVPYYRSEGGPVKRVFFTTSTGQRVVAYIVPLANTDRHGRKPYLAHSLVFTPEVFARLGADPFWAFRHFPFLTTVEEALKRGDFRTGDIPVVALKLPVEPERITEAVRGWSTQALKKLTLLALRANQSVHDHQAVAIVGEPPKVENALEAAFCAVPALLRPYCTFDTYVYKCTFPPSYYWARGELTPPSNPIFTLVDTQSHQVMGSDLEQPETAYERWVVHMLESNDLMLLHPLGTMLLPCVSGWRVVLTLSPW